MAKGMKRFIDGLEEKNKRLENKVAQLRKDLLKYGSHLSSCCHFTDPVKNCNCGWVNAARENE